MTERMSAAQFRAAFARPREPKKKKAPKYRNNKVMRLGHAFDSQLEADHYVNVLRPLELGRVISDLRLQVAFDLLGPNGPLLGENNHKLRYVADFVYRNEAGELVIEDCKGFKTPAYQLKKAIMRNMGFTIREVERR